MHERNVSFEVNQRKKIFSRLVVLEYEYFERIASRIQCFLLPMGHFARVIGHTQSVRPSFPDPGFGFGPLCRFSIAAESRTLRH